VLIFCIAGLLFFVLRARQSLGAYRIPWETGLLIPSGKRNHYAQSSQYTPASGSRPYGSSEIAYTQAKDAV